MEGNIFRVNRVHFPIIEINFDVYDTISSENTFTASGLNTFFHRGDEGSIYVLAYERLCKFYSFSTLFGFNSHPNLSELPCTARLFFVSVFGFAFSFNCFAERNFRFNQIEIYFVSLADLFGYNFHVQITLAGDNCLMKLRINDIMEGWIFGMNLRESNSHFFFYLTNFW